MAEKTLANSLFQINTDIKASVKLREKTLVIGHNVMSLFQGNVTHVCVIYYIVEVTDSAGCIAEM